MRETETCERQRHVATYGDNLVFGMQSEDLSGFRAAATRLHIDAKAKITAPHAQPWD